MISEAIVILAIFQVGLTNKTDIKPKLTCTPSDGGKLTCSPGCAAIGYCFNGVWYNVEFCNSGQVCDHTGVEPRCITGNTCSVTTGQEQVRCGGSGYSVPNMVDESCSTYYPCVSSTASVTSTERIFTPNLRWCPTGQVFDYCSGLCSIYNTNCSPNPQSSCDGVQSTDQTQLPNSNLHYACVGGIKYWTPIATQGTTCDNAGKNDGKCTSAVAMAIPGTNCYFRACKTDLSYADIKCQDGYHFEPTLKTCVNGPCTTWL